MVVGAEGRGEGRGASIVALATSFTLLLPVVAVRLGEGSEGDAWVKCTVNAAAQRGSQKTSRSHPLILPFI